MQFVFVYILQSSQSTNISIIYPEKFMYSKINFFQNLRKIFFKQKSCLLKHAYIFLPQSNLYLLAH